MRETRGITLRIKKIYFDRILSGEKTREFREYKDYYHALFQGPTVKTIRFHYQYFRQLVVEVKTIRVKRTSKKLSLIKTPKVYEIILGKILEYRE